MIMKFGHGHIFFLAVFIALGMVMSSGGHVCAGDGEVDFLRDDFYEDYAGISEYDLDRLETMNRAVFIFNDKMYIWVLEPVATAYSHVLPFDIRLCIYNFFRNLEEPVRLFNTLLQGRFSDAGNVLVRFLVNTTCGIYGLADAADRVFDFPPVEATLGETLATWGVGDGSYLVVPLYGSTTIRDFAGTVVDGFGLTPYYTWTDDLFVVSSIYFGKETNKLSMRLGEYEELKKVFFDPYVAFRNAYYQYRRKLRDHPPSVKK